MATHPIPTLPSSNSQLLKKYGRPVKPADHYAKCLALLAEMRLPDAVQAVIDAESEGIYFLQSNR